MTAEPVAPRADVDVDAVVAAVLAVRGVARLGGGAFGEIATYLPGRRVTGVRVNGDHLDVHVVANWVPSLPDLAWRVRRAALPYAPGATVDVTIDDVVLDVLDVTDVTAEALR